MPSYYGRGKTLVSAPTTTGGTWANTANMVDGTGGVINATLGTWTSTTNGGTATAIFGNFEAPTVVAGESLVSLGCIVRHGFSSVARIQSVTAQAMDNGVNIGSPVSFNISNAQTSDKVILPVTENQLRSPTFQIKIVATRKTVTQSCVWSVDFVDLDIDTALPMPKTETLVDEFTTDNTTLWPTGLRYNNAVITGGRVALTEMSAAYSGIATTANAYSLEDSYVFCKATVPAVQTNTTETTLSVYGPTNANGVFFILFKDVSGQQICMRRTVATVTDNAFLPYDPVAMAWIRVRKDSGTMYWDTSPDGTTWTNRRTLAGALNLGQVTVELSVGQWAAEATQSTGYFDNLNIVPAVVTGGKPKVYVGGSWQPKPVKVYLAGSWQEKPMKRWDGSQWKPV